MSNESSSSSPIHEGAHADTEPAQFANSDFTGCLPDLGISVLIDRCGGLGCVRSDHWPIILTGASRDREDDSECMASVVFLKGVNVGGRKTFRPSVLASALAKLGVINVGAAGTFVVRKSISQAKLRREFRRCLPFETEAMICSGNDIVRLASGEPFAGEPSGPGIVRFVSILAKRPRVAPALPLNLPPGEDWLVRIVAIRGRFAFGLYRRTMRTIACLSRIERCLGGSVTTRNWNTFSSVIEILGRSDRVDV